MALGEVREGLGGLKLDEVEAANSFLMLPLARWPRNITITKNIGILPIFGVIWRLFWVYFGLILDPWGQPWGPLEAEGRPSYSYDFFLHEKPL